MPSLDSERKYIAKRLTRVNKTIAAIIFFGAIPIPLMLFGFTIAAVVLGFLFFCFVVLCEECFYPSRSEVEDNLAKVLPALTLSGVRVNGAFSPEILLNDPAGQAMQDSWYDDLVH